uniref:ATP synthase F0 subunit 8 n=1 Tax=Polistes dorsalis californicus TaxID=430784 RepID=A0A0U2DVR6_POLDR|nr:ATP synthase F0 subunit 8 [Polistes dorsalis californicus]
MPQISPLKWIILYFTTLMIFFIMIIKFNFLMKFINKNILNDKNNMNHCYTNKISWKF